jgi:hypothetical protein
VRIEGSLGGAETGNQLTLHGGGVGRAEPERSPVVIVGLRIARPRRYGALGNRNRALPEFNTRARDTAEIVVHGDRTALVEDLEPRHGGKRSVRGWIFWSGVACLFEERDRLLTIEVIGKVESLFPQLGGGLTRCRRSNREEQPAATEGPHAQGPVRQPCATRAPPLRHPPPPCRGT